MSKLSIVVNGLVRENPVLVLVLGICPTLAVSTQVENALGMGIATTFVFLGSNVAISLLRKIIPDTVRIPCYIVLIAGFATLVQMAVEAYAYTLYQSLGIYLPLIAVNCIVFGRAEMFANKNTVPDSALDAIGMGSGFTLALVVIASIREIFGSGTWFGFKLPLLVDNNIEVFSLAPGGFIVFGLVIAAVNKISGGKALNHQGIDCAGCLSAAACGKLSAAKISGERAE